MLKSLKFKTTLIKSLIIALTLMLVFCISVPIHKEIQNRKSSFADTQKTVKIYTAEQLIAIRDEINSTNNKTNADEKTVTILIKSYTIYVYNIELEDDISLTDFNEGIGTSDYPFYGTFDGKGHTITLKSSGSSISSPIFNCIGKSKIFGHTLYTSTIQKLNVKFDSYYLDSKNNESAIAAGLAKCAFDTTIKNCSVTGNISVRAESTSGKTEIISVGGFCGKFSGTMEDCENRVNISVKCIKAGTTKIFQGGFVGSCVGSSTFTNLLNRGTLTAEGYATVFLQGGIVAETGTNCSFNNCVVFPDNYSSDYSLRNPDTTTANSDSWGKQPNDEQCKYRTSGNFGEVGCLYAGFIYSFENDGTHYDEFSYGGSTITKINYDTALWGAFKWVTGCESTEYNVTYSKCYAYKYNSEYEKYIISELKDSYEIGNILYNCSTHGSKSVYTVHPHWAS